MLYEALLAAEKENVMRKAAKEAAGKWRRERQQVCKLLRIDIGRDNRTGSSDPDVRYGPEMFVDPWSDDICNY